MDFKNQSQYNLLKISNLHTKTVYFHTNLTIPKILLLKRCFYDVFLFFQVDF